MKRRITSRVSLFLLIIFSIGLVITTLHSHHHLEWKHNSDFPDTGHCISVDIAMCPISGYIFETDVLTASHSCNTFFSTQEVITEKDIHVDHHSTFVNRGRAPPALI